MKKNLEFQAYAGKVNVKLLHSWKDYTRNSSLMERLIQKFSLNKKEISNFKPMMERLISNFQLHGKVDLEFTASFKD